MSADAWRMGAAVGMAAALGLAACQPTVRVEAPDKPIEINLNVRIDQEIRIRMDPEIDRLIEENPELFD